MRIFKLNTLLLLLVLSTGTVLAQHKKLDKTFKTNEDVKINLDARHTNVSFETWNKNEVRVEAYIDGKIDAAEAKALLDSWQFDARGNAVEVTISSGGGMMRQPDMNMAALTESLGHLQELIAPLMTEMVAPMMQSFSENPPLPPDFADKMGALNFDFEAYQKDGEKYMKKWEEKIEQKFGKDFEASMEKWAAQFEKNAEVWEKNMEKKMEVKGEKFEKSMEKWAESFGAEMEKWGEQFEKEMEAREGNSGVRVMSIKGGAKANRHLKIMIPANAKLNLDVRHGEVKLGEKTTNLKASLSHSQLTANIIDGQGTEVKASYSPIRVSQWNYGVLNTSYVQNCEIKKARSIKLVSNSSDVSIGEIEETGILSGTFGELKIGKLNPAFKNLDISLKNSDLHLSIPKTGLNFNYNGSQSKIDYPKAATVKSTTSYDNQLLNGYYGAGNANRSISINATFSEIVIK
ncbi:hypothetical protein FHG64_04740 [Antarcticibacterium flavum]|uniref:DUF4097 domain-containing protein n=1 Tax=Antarcticibacterium flavum TaxID=2058175 RepID=A0A5B7X297_9FLAO|nr:MULTISPECIES: hypothetical protein [Antarcticibacterium]MCM4160768.1 hypothetical protein [Antarcticibacterium sp. W02-3]QCY68758.1 hypothetical protein FHG64_04740 [Antarcticibacterium flavum]